VKREGSFSFLVGTISNVLVMEIGWIDVGSRGYILVSYAHSNTSIKTLDDNPSFSKNLVHSFISIKLASLKRCLSLGSDSNSSGRRPALKMTVLVLILVFVKRGGSLSFLTIFTLTVPELLDLI
jgi:hypothetical protein